MKMVAGLAFVVLAAACTGGGSNGESKPASTTTSSRPEATIAGESRVRIEIPHTLVAGTTVSGTLVFTNPTGAPLSLQTNGGCKPKYAVVIRNDAIPQIAAFPASCELGSMGVAEGTSRLPFQALVSYLGCTRSPTPQSQSAACSASGGLPPLPPGRYEATLQASDSGVPAARPVPVRVVSPK